MIHKHGKSDIARQEKHQGAALETREPLMTCQLAIQKRRLALK
jgi:hypothetical protein